MHGRLLGFCIERLPINRNAPEHFSLIGKLQKLLVSGDCDRCAASFTGGSNV
jgi:hypothetical protein